MLPPTNEHSNIKPPSTARLSPNNAQQTFNTTPTLNTQNYATKPSHPNVTLNAPPTNEHPNIEPPSTASSFINESQDTLDIFSKTNFSTNEKPPSNPYNQTQEMCTPEFNPNTPPTNNNPNSERTLSTASLSPNNTQQTFNTTPTFHIQNYDTDPSQPTITLNAPPTNEHTNIGPSSAASLFINEPQRTLDFFSKTNFSTNEEQPSNPYNPTQQMFTPNFNVITPSTNKQTTIKLPSFASLFMNEPQDGFDFFSTTTISKNEGQSPNRDDQNQKTFVSNLNNNFSPSKKTSYDGERPSIISRDQQQTFDLFSTSSTPKDEGQTLAPNSNINKQTTQDLHTPSVQNSLNVEIETLPGNFRTRKPRHIFRTPLTHNKKQQPFVSVPSHSNPLRPPVFISSSNSPYAPATVVSCTSKSQPFTANYKPLICSNIQKLPSFISNEGNQEQLPISPLLFQTPKNHNMPRTIITIYNSKSLILPQPQHVICHYKKITIQPLVSSCQTIWTSLQHLI